MTDSETNRAIDAVWRMESAKVIAGLARIVRDVGVAEELAQDALVAALEQWPKTGVPEKPGAWLMAAGKKSRHRLFPPQQPPRTQARGARPRHQRATAHGGSRFRCRHRRRHWR